MNTDEISMTGVLEARTNARGKAGLSEKLLSPRANNIQRLIREYISSNPITVALFVFEVLVMTTVFAVTYVTKSHEATKSLLAASDCSSATTDGSYNLNPQDSATSVQMEILTPNVLSPSGYNYSSVVITAEWSSCAIPMQYTAINLHGGDDSHNFASNSTEFIIPSSMNTTAAAEDEVDSTFSLGISGSVSSSSGRCFQLMCSASVSSGANGFVVVGIPNATPLRTIGSGSMGQLVGIISVESNTVSASCFGSFSGVIVTAASFSNNVVKSDIIVCTQYSGVLTLLGIALTYSLTTFSVFRMVQYVYDVYRK
jgi:hypothetical protein